MHHPVYGYAEDRDLLSEVLLFFSKSWEWWYIRFFVNHYYSELMISELDIVIVVGPSRWELHDAWHQRTIALGPRTTGGFGRSAWLWLPA